MQENYKNILITGGCGFMGSNFIRHLYRKYPSYRIFNLDLLTYAGNLDNLVDIETADGDKHRYQLIQGDVCDPVFLDEIFNKYRFDMVIHFAAETHVDRSIFNVTDFIRTNVDGTYLLIEAVRKHNIPRIVHISTDEVYGSVPEGFSKEDAHFRPSSPYATSKACADLLVQSYMRINKVPAIIIRGSNNFGTYQYPEKLIPLVITNLIDGKKIPIHGNGQHIRSWIHVNDFCNAIDIVAHNAPVGSIYNASGEKRTNMEIMNAIAKHMNVALDDHKEHVEDRPHADHRYNPDSTKLESELGWSRQHTIEDSMGDVVKWYVKNPTWWRKIKSKKEYQDHYAKQSQGKWY